MGASNSQIDSDSDPRYNIEKNSKHCSTNFQRLQYHGVRYPKGRPDPPEGSPTAQNITQSSVTLKWTPPYGCPTSTILAYQIEVCRVQDKRWKMVTNSCQGNTYDVKNLAPGTDYMFRVRTENVYGKSKPSAPSEVIKTLSENRWMTAREDKEADDRGVRLTRRHSHYIKVENSVSNLLQKTDKEEEMSEVGTIPFKRNSSIRHSLPVQCVRRTSPLPSSILPGSRRESVCSLKDRESRKSIEESSVFTDDTDEVSSLKLKRFSLASTEDDSCKCSSSAASMTSIPEELNDSKGEKDSDLFIVKTPPPTWRYNSQSHDILSAPYSDDTKLAWVTDQKSPLPNHQNSENTSPVWRDRPENNKNLPDFRSLRNALNSNDLLVKTLNADNNGNYSTLNSKGKLYEKVIKEEDEHNISMDIVSNV